MKNIAKKALAAHQGPDGQGNKEQSEAARSGSPSPPPSGMESPSKDEGANTSEAIPSSLDEIPYAQAGTDSIDSSAAVSMQASCSTTSEPQQRDFRGDSEATQKVAGMLPPPPPRFASQVDSQIQSLSAGRRCQRTRTRTPRRSRNSRNICTTHSQHLSCSLNPTTPSPAALRNRHMRHTRIPPRLQSQPRLPTRTLPTNKSTRSRIYPTPRPSLPASLADAAPSTRIRSRMRTASPATRTHLWSRSAMRDSGSRGITRSAGRRTLREPAG